VVNAPSPGRAKVLHRLAEINQIKEEAVFNVVASIRDNVRNLPPERYAEIFADFEGAVKSNDIGYLADTVVNWALGGHGYDYAGAPVNHLEPVITADADPETRAAWDSFWTSDSEE
jgi:hypothetical protein